MRRKSVVILMVLILSGVFLSKIFFTQRVSIPEYPAANRATQKAVVRVTEVKRGSLKFILSYVGSLKAKDEINVFSKVSGKLYEYTVKEGDAVEKGEQIALVDRDETGLKYELARVESPISGIVGRTLFDKGAVVQGAPVAVIVNMDEMVVRLYGSEQDIPYLKEGLKAEASVDAYANEIFLGKITKVSQVVDPLTRTLPIEISLPNTDWRLKSGMFCRIKIIASEHKDALYLTQDAIVQELGANYVFAVEDNLARKRKVSLGIQEDSRIEILDGVKENETVIVFGQQGLKDGSLVEIAKE